MSLLGLDAVCPCPPALDVASGVAVVLANPTAVTPTDPSFVTLLNGAAPLAGPRQIQLISTEPRPRPFEARITWAARNAAGATGGYLEVTAQAGVLQLFVWAATLRIEVANWHTAAQTISGEVQGGSMQTSDLHKIHRDLNLASAGVLTLDVPPFAQWVTVYPASIGQRPNLNVELLDGAGVVIAREVASSENEIYLGAADQVRLRNNGVGSIASVLTDFRLGWN